MGIDWGEKRIGLSLGDSLTKTATPFKVVNNQEEIIKIIEEEEIDVVVVGQPLKMSGSGQLSADFLLFLETLKVKLNVPVEIIDERLSSKAADSLIGDKKTKAPRDAVAAMLILQSYFDRI